MAFSATDWRNRMNYYDGYYSSYTWGALGTAQGNRTYWLNPYTFYDGAGVYYIQCGTGYNTPCVEAFYVYSSWVIYYNVYLQYSFYSNSYSGQYNNGTWYTYYPQSSTNVVLGYAYRPSNYYYTYFYFTQGYVEVDETYSFVFSGVSSASPQTFYNYKNGPFLSYYQYSLSNGTYTNYPYQYLVIYNGSC